ncbi:hypothetical protein ABB37_05887 [Leptomonas pyrrhocoris]|uniref:Uncharacterized protein n=1 Tax=Leptomonas pyrrhocoris TaxID=157538 RepID=A0A0M9FZ16_LEPPY|nr:hypothetical protein ABB37_05887 [Leptomonas pyrrhocoris]KPA78786.1 hypothetical protein ABB37_05887 [Leptomonas pyrrhocoris]|eukprot:XP_015657225.1 hypothetical protein ABB37_05887 [Leptomonas pyrrhocoris]
MSYVPIDSFFDLMCGAATSTPSSAVSGPLCTASSAATSAAWELSPFFTLLTERHVAVEWCQVWAANLLLTFSIAVVVFFRIWRTCGNLPPSDTFYEPALGRVLQAFTQPNNGEEARDTRPSPSHTWNPSRSCVRGSRVPPLRGRGSTPADVLPCDPCYSSYLSADPSSAAAASPMPTFEYAAAGEDDVDVFDACAAGNNKKTRLERLWHVVSACGALRALLEPQRMANERLHAFLCGCAAAWQLLWMPFSVLPSFSSFHSGGQQSLTKRLWPHCHPPSRECDHRPPHRVEEDAWTQELLDLSDDDQEDLLAEQEELWGIIEGIERRRRALTGRNLFRQPLPSRSQRRLARMSASSAALNPPQGAAPASSAVAVIPILAAGVPLRFSVDRKARPVLVDRQGRWIPVAVIDEDGEYYNYNTDQVLPQS